MFQLDEAWDEIKKVIGVCDDQKTLRWATDAVQLVMSKLDGEYFKGFLDLCTVGCSCGGIGSTCNSPAGCGRKCIALPREVGTVLAVNIGGQPTLGVGQLMSFHLNGLGDCRTICQWQWQDGGQNHCTYRDLITPARLVAYLQREEDNGKVFLIYGYDTNGNVLRRQVNGQWVNGIQIPTIFGVAVPDMDQPVIARITGIFKERTAGNIRLSTVDDSGATGVLLGVYEPDDETPSFRRITLNRSCNWVRIAYRKSNPKFTSRFDHVPMLSRRAFILAVQAVKFYSDTLVAEANQFEANATRIELEAQQVVEATTTYMPVNVVIMGNQINNQTDYDIR